FAATDRKARERLARGFARAARQAQEHGRLVTVESADNFPQRARYGGPDAQAAAERIFEASSDALVALLHAEHEAGTESDRHEALVRANDALTRGLGLDGAARRALAERRRRAFAARLGEDDEALRLAYRTRQRGLLASLMADTQADRRRQGARAEAQDPLAALFAALRTASARAAKTLAATDRAALERALPALLHVQAVRFLGLDPVGEQLSHVLWARALEGLAASTRGRDEGA
ncbi:MAG TPA: thiopeptide-type bacteriocin biosynthesis protein, partial [Polyangia bacterium]